MANTYLIQQGDTASQIAQRYGTTVQALQQANPQYQQFTSNPDYIQAGWSLNLPQQQQSPQLEPMQPSQTLAADITGAPSPPTYEPPPPPDDLSLKTQLEQQRKALEETYQSQLDQINKQLEDQRRIQEQEKAKQLGVLGQLEQQITPFRADIERTERERLKIEENYFANQALVNELDRLLTESMEMTRKLQTQRVPGLAGLQQSERMIKAQQNVQGRIAVVEAVMAARNNQIGVAQGFIDRTIDAIRADRQDRISYLESLYKFYEETRSEAGTKIFNLTQDQKGIINSQIGLIKGDMERAEKVADTIREMMLENPLMASEAGISLDDSEEEVVRKLADWQYTTEIRDLRNSAEKEGLKELTPGQAATKPAEQIFTQTDSRGVERHFLLPPDTPEWQLKFVDNSLYRVDPKTGDAEVLIGGTSPSALAAFKASLKGGTKWINPDTEEEMNAYDAARWIVENNPTLSDDELRLRMREQELGLSETDMKNIIDGREVSDEQIAETSRDLFSQWKELGMSKKDIETQWKKDNKHPEKAEMPEPEKSVLDELFPGGGSLFGKIADFEKHSPIRGTKLDIRTWFK